MSWYYTHLCLFKCVNLTFLKINKDWQLKCLPLKDDKSKISSTEIMCDFTVEIITMLLQYTHKLVTTKIVVINLVLKAYINNEICVIFQF